MTNVAEQYRQIALQTVKEYQSDIEIDCGIIEQGTPTVFYIREWGTHALQLVPFESYPPAGERVKYLFARVKREHILEQVTEMLQHHTDNPEIKQVIFFDGEKLSTITKHRGERIVEEYVRKMWSMFRHYNGLKAEEVA